MPGATAPEIGEHSVLYLTMTDASNVASVLFSALKTVSARMGTATLKLTFIIVKDAASVPVSAGHRQ